MKVRFVSVMSLVSSLALLSLVGQSTLWSQEREFEVYFSDSDPISEIMKDLEALFSQRAKLDEAKKSFYAQGLRPSGDEFDDVFPPNPISRPLIPSSRSPYPGFIPTHGAAYLVAMEVLYQTLEYYGVKHYFGKKGSRVEFEVISSKDNYFGSLDSAQVAFALREFSRYLTSHTCNDPSIENFSKMFAQIPLEELGLRFKFDMAWALMGNYLPKEANSIYQMSQKWSVINQAATGQRSLPAQDGQSLSQYLTFITDAINFLQAMNRSNCFVDISIDPREEILKRVTVKKFLNLERSLFERYAENYEIIQAIRVAEDRERAESLKEQRSQESDEDF